MAESLRQRLIIITPYANRSFQPGPRAAPARKHDLVTLTRPNREKLSQPRKVNLGPYPPAMQRNWLATITAKEAEATASSQPPHLPSQQKHQLLSSLLHLHLLIQSTVQFVPQWGNLS